MLLFGLRVETIYGSSLTLLLFLASGVLGNLLSLPIVGANDGVGASGGVMGMVGAVAAAFVRAPGLIPARVRNGQLKDIALIVMLQVLVDRSVPQVNGTAHIFGALTGFFLGLALFSASRLRLRGRREVALRWLGVALTLALLPGGWAAWRNYRAERLLAQARAEAQAGKVAVADQLTLQSLAINPRSFAANWLLGGIKLIELDGSGTVAAEQRAIGLYPKDAGPYRLLGEAQYRLCSFRESLASCQTARSLAPPEGAGIREVDSAATAFAALDSFCLADFRSAQELARDYLRRPEWESALSPAMVMIDFLSGWTVEKRSDTGRLQPLTTHDPQLYDLLTTDRPPKRWTADEVVYLAYLRFYQGRPDQAARLLRLAQPHLSGQDVALPLADLLKTRL